jgi:hypothetical protein
MFGTITEYIYGTIWTEQVYLQKQIQNVWNTLICIWLDTFSVFPFTQRGQRMLTIS